VPGPSRAAAAWIPSAAWAALIFGLSSIPLGPGSRLFPGSDLVAHLGLYGVLGFLLARAAGRTLPRWRGGAVVLAAGILGTVYGATDEAHQALVPGREPEAADLLSDGCGAFLGAAAAAAAARRRGANAGAGEADPAPAAPAPPPPAPDRP
jgi:VanZ family protein